MALLRTLVELSDLAVLVGGSRVLCRHGRAMVGARRHSLPGGCLAHTTPLHTCEGGRGEMFREPQQLNVTSRHVSHHAQPRIPSSVSEIQSSIQDHIDPRSGVVKTKKFVVTWQELEQMLEGGPNAVKLIDVREPKEVEETGLLPRAINIPLSTLKASLQLSPEMFEALYGVVKPTRDDPTPLVFYARSAVKSSTALEIAYKLGLKKSRHYPGGWEEWSTRHQPGL